MYFGTMGLYGGFGMIFFWLIFIGVIIWLFNQQNNNPKQESAIDIARKRYAKGEITKKQFDELKQNLI